MEKTRWQVTIREEHSISIKHTTEVEAATLDEAFRTALDWWEDQAPTNSAEGVCAIELWRRERPWPTGFVWPARG